MTDTDAAVAPTISGTVGGQQTTADAPVDPFSGVTIGDLNANATDTLTITLSRRRGDRNAVGGGPDRRAPAASTP